MSHNSMGAMGDMASGFVSGQGGFDPATGKYSAEMNANPNGSSFAFDAQTMNTQAALNGALAFDGKHVIEHGAAQRLQFNHPPR